MIAYNHAELTSISPLIGILNVKVKTARIKTSTYSPAKVDGLRRIYKTRQEKKITITFDIFTSDPEERLDILNQCTPGLIPMMINGWKSAGIPANT